MNNFYVIYKILYNLDKYKGDEAFDYRSISPEAMGISFTTWEQLMIELQANGYIRGLVYTKTLSDKFPHIIEPIEVQITLRGMEYLEDNSMMAKAKEALRLAGDIL